MKNKILYVQLMQRTFEHLKNTAYTTETAFRYMLLFKKGKFYEKRKEITHFQKQAF